MQVTKRWWICGDKVLLPVDVGRKPQYNGVRNIATKMATFWEEGSEMARVGVRELKNQATEIIRNVRENQAEYVVTYHGRPVAVLLPVDQGWLEAEARRAAEAATPSEDVWAELEALRQEIGRSWRSDKSAVELISEQRR
jgi:prevent-host-death family protein